VAEPVATSFKLLALTKRIAQLAVEALQMFGHNENYVCGGQIFQQLSDVPVTETNSVARLKTALLVIGQKRV